MGLIIKFPHWEKYCIFSLAFGPVLGSLTITSVHRPCIVVGVAILESRAKGMLKHPPPKNYQPWFWFHFLTLLKGTPIKIYQVLIYAEQLGSFPIPECVENKVLAFLQQTSKWTVRGPWKLCLGPNRFPQISWIYSLLCNVSMGIAW